MECNYTRLDMSCKRRDHSLNIPGRIYTVGHTSTCTYPCAVNVFPGSKLLSRRRCPSLGLIHHFKLKLLSHTWALSCCCHGLLLATLVIGVLWQRLKRQMIKRVTLICVGSVGVDLQRQIFRLVFAHQAKTV